MKYSSKDNHSSYQSFIPENVEIGMRCDETVSDLTFIALQQEKIRSKERSQSCQQLVVRLPCWIKCMLILAMTIVVAMLAVISADLYVTYLQEREDTGEIKLIPTNPPTDVHLSKLKANFFVKSNNGPNSISFVVTGGNIVDELKLQTENVHEEQDENRNSVSRLYGKNVDFIIHLGNLNAEKYEMCGKANYVNLHEKIIANLTVPIFAIPGRNDWLYCQNARQAYSYWVQYIGAPAHRKEEGVRTQGKKFAFEIQSILFLGFESISGDSTINLEWFEEQVESSGDGLRSIFAFGNFEEDQQFLDSFWLPFCKIVETIGLPTLYVKGSKDSHRWSLENDVVENLGILNVEVGVVPFMKVVIDTSVKVPVVTFSQR